MEYRIAKGWRIVAVIFSLIFIIGGMAFLLSPWYTENMQKTTLLAMMVGLAFIAMGVASWADTLKQKITIDGISISHQGAFKQKSLLLADIKGYRQEKNYLFLIPKSGKGAIQISNYLENLRELKTWVKEKYPDVDQQVVEQETKVILTDEHFGNTEDERNNQLNQATTVCKAFNIASTVIIGWLFIYPKPYQTAWAIALLVVPASLYILWHFKGLVTVNDTKKSAYPSMLPVLMFSPIIILVRALIDYDIYRYSNLWLYSIGIAAILTAALYNIAYKGHQKNINKKPSLYILAFVFAAYGFGATVFYNCRYDTTQPVLFAEPVTAMRVSTGKTTTYYITTAPWGRYTEPEEMSVAKSLYQSLKTGDTVNIFLQQGKLGIPWYFVERQENEPPPTEVNK